MSRIKKNELRKIIRKSLLKEFVPGQVSAGTVDSAAFSMQARAERVQSAMKPKKGGVYRALMSPQKLNFDLKSEPNAFEKIIADANAFFQTYTLAMSNWAGSVIPTALTNWVYSQGSPEWEKSADLARRKAKRIDQIKTFESLDIVGTYNGQIVIDGPSFQQLAQSAPYLLQKPFTSANVRDFARILKILGGEVDVVDRALGKIGAFPEWEEFKSEHLPGMINKANAVMGTKMKSGEAESLGSSPLLFIDASDNIYDALEYFKYECNAKAPTAWYEFEVKWVPGAAHSYSAGGIGGAISGAMGGTTAGSLKVKIINASTKTIATRIELLLKQIAAANADYQILLSSGALMNAVDFDELVEGLQATMKPRMELKGINSAAGKLGILSNPKGNDDFVASALDYKKVGRVREAYRRKSLLKEELVTVTIGDWLDQVRDSQQSAALGNPTDFDPLQNGDRVDLWLGPNPNAPPSVSERVSSTGAVKPGNNPLAMWFLSQIFQADNRKKIGLEEIQGEAGPPVIDNQLVLPSPKNLAFYFVQKDRLKGGEAYVNPFDIADFRNEVQSELEARYGKNWVISIGTGIEPKPEEAAPEAEAKGKCPDTPFKPDFQKSQSDKLKQIEKVVDAYITLHSLTATVSSDGNPWNDMPAWKMLVDHAKENNPAFKAMSGVNWDKVGGDWAEGAPTLGGRGYTPNLNGMLAFAADAYNCDAEFGKKKISGGSGGTSKPEPEEAAEETEEVKPKGKKRTWRDIEVMFAGKAGRNKKVDTWKKEIAKTTAKFIVQNGLANVTREEHGIFDLGVGGRIKPRTSDDWRVSKQYKPVINKAINKIITGILKTRGTLEISIPPGHYSGMNEAAEFVDVLRTLIRDSK